MTCAQWSLGEVRFLSCVLTSVRLPVADVASVALSGIASFSAIRSSERFRTLRHPSDRPNGTKRIRHWPLGERASRDRHPLGRLSSSTCRRFPSGRCRFKPDIDRYDTILMTHKSRCEHCDGLVPRDELTMFIPGGRLCSDCDTRRIE